MTLRVLIVDDSTFMCTRIKQILHEDAGIQVVGTAENGLQALNQTIKLQPDVITMDVEMPVMDGITAVRQIMEDCPTPILMFSASTQIGAQATLDALNAGAIDFLPKRLDDIDNDRETAKRLLRMSVRVVAQQARKIKEQCGQSAPVKKALDYSHVNRNQKKKEHRPLERPDLLMIAASTGGPVAIQQIIKEISMSCAFPILLIQHMPDTFTKSFAERLNELSAIKVKLAEDGEILQAGVALLAPGGKQMEVVKKGNKLSIKLRPKQLGEIYCPSVDVTFSSVAQVMNGNILAVVLTGMGADGKQGACLLKRIHAQIWAQDEASSTIYGMPKAIVDARLADQVYSLDEIADQFTLLS